MRALLLVAGIIMIPASLAVAQEPTPAEKFKTQMRQLDESVDRDMKALRERQKANLKHIDFCLDRLQELGIGDSNKYARALMDGCAHKVHITETAQARHEQWAYEFLDGNVYLYFTNGKLVAEQQ